MTATPAQPPTLSHLRELESEAIYVLRETAAQFENPGLLFSGGKDSIVMAHLAAKAFHPAHIPFPLVHIDTGHNFAETIEFRDGVRARLQRAPHHRQRARFDSMTPEPPSKRPARPPRATRYKP